MDYYNARQISNVMATISKMLPASTNVVRDGREFKVPAVELVPGDLVHLTIGELHHCSTLAATSRTRSTGNATRGRRCAAAGNRVPADIRILSAADFKVEMSSLTGESVVVARHQR